MTSFRGYWFLLGIVKLCDVPLLRNARNEVMEDARACVALLACLNQKAAKLWAKWLLWRSACYNYNRRMDCHEIWYWTSFAEIFGYTWGNSKGLCEGVFLCTPLEISEWKVVGKNEKHFLPSTLLRGFEVIKQKELDYVSVHGSCLPDYDEISYWISLHKLIEPFQISWSMVQHPCLNM
jgi:hypothetical protein